MWTDQQIKALRLAELAAIRRLIGATAAPVNTPSEWIGWQVIVPDAETRRYLQRAARGCEPRRCASGAGRRASAVTAAGPRAGSRGAPAAGNRTAAGAGGRVPVKGYDWRPYCWCPLPQPRSYETSRARAQDVLLRSRGTKRRLTRSYAVQRTNSRLWRLQ